MQRRPGRDVRDQDGLARPEMGRLFWRLFGDGEGLLATGEFFWRRGVVLATGRLFWRRGACSGNRDAPGDQDALLMAGRLVRRRQGNIWQQNRTEHARCACSITSASSSARQLSCRVT
eukprot:360249-Chlamydomonas_euryale.AAC.1